MERTNKTHTIGEIMTGFSVFGKNFEAKVRRSAKNSTIFSFWEDIVGLKFAKFTRPIAIKYSKLYVSTKSPIIAQELSFAKMRIIKKINTLCASMGVEVKDIVFDYKNFSSLKEEDKSQKNEHIWHDKDYILSLDIDEKELLKLDEIVEKIDFMDNNQKKNLKTKIESALKAKNMRKADLDR